MAVSVVAPVSRRPRPTWGQWQQSTVSQRLLSEKDRQQGFTVLWVPPSLRPTFLLVAEVFRVYDRLWQKRHRVLSAAQLAQLLAWTDATQALLTALQEAPHD